MRGIYTKIKKKGFIGSLKALKTRAVNYTNRLFLSYKLENQLNKLSDIWEKGNIYEIRERTLTYIESMRLKEKPYGQYRYSQSQNKPILYASCYAALTRHLYHDLDNLTENQKKEWINYIQSFQCEDGLFRDPAVDNEIAEDSDWWGWRHLTLHALMALSALGAIAKKRFQIVNSFKNTDSVIKWLEGCDWIVDPAATSNKVQNYFTILQYARDFHGEAWADKTLQVAYEWLEEKQDPKTGLWGVRFDTPLTLSNGVQTGYHIWLLFFYDRRPIQYIERIIDSCLKTQNKLGGFGVPLNSSACEDIDSIDPLVRLYFMSNYRREDIKSSLWKSIPWILVNLNEDGGFVFRRGEPFVYGHQLMSSNKDESAMFPTWFRTLSLAYLAKVFPESFLGKYDWQFLKSPGLQFWNL